MSNEPKASQEELLSEVSIPDQNDQAVGAKMRSSTTNVHDAGSDANETEDGLNSSDELTRRLAEDVPTGASERSEEMPVFDRGYSLPRI